MAKTIQIKPEEALARAYADRLILGKLTELQAAVKLSEIADKLQAEGIGLSTIRSLLASNPEAFAYSERRWIPAARLEGAGRPFAEGVRLLVERFGGPMPLDLAVRELAHSRNLDPEKLEAQLVRLAITDDTFVLTRAQDLVLSTWVFCATDQTVDRALAINRLTREEVAEVEAKLGDFDWRSPSAVRDALAKTAPVSIRALGAAAWIQVNPQGNKTTLVFDWREFAAEALSVPGYVYGGKGVITKEADAKKWITTAIKLADRIAPTVEVEDAAPIDIKQEDVARMVERILSTDESVTARRLLEEFYEVTPSTKTYPDDLENVMNGLKANSSVWWVGGDRFRKPNSAPEIVYSVPEPFQYQPTAFTDDEGELIDVELTDEGLSTTLRKLLSHPLATDVLDEEIQPVPKTMPESLRLVLKPIHRELGTFPLCQFQTGWLSDKPGVQELILIDPDGRELQVWANMEARLIFDLVDWFYEQPVESGAVFSLTKTEKSNVLEFAWLDQTDPVVFITSQRMEELRTMQERGEEMSTLQILQEVMAHWPKGADFLTLLWEVNVVRRSTRRLVASLLSSYQCFYQRSGSPVWHFDAKKVEQGFDKSKRKFVKK